MSYSKETLFEYIKRELDTRQIRYQVHSFATAIMVDIWYGNFFYVAQIDDRAVGLSKIEDESPGFDTVPDEMFYDNQSFIGKFQALFT